MTGKSLQITAHTHPFSTIMEVLKLENRIASYTLNVFYMLVLKPLMLNKPTTRVVM